MKKVSSKLSLLAVAGITFAVMSTGISSCSKSNNNNNGGGGGGGGDTTTLVGGFLSSDSVEPTNLIAYFPFDADANDHKGGLTAVATGSGVTFTSAGIRNKSYQGAQGSYFTLALPSGGGPFAKIGSYSESFWFKMAAQGTATQGIFFLSGANTQDELVTEIETYAPASGDSVRIHTGFNDLNDAPNYQLFIPESFDTSAVGKWVHQVITYDSSTSTYTVYENAQAIGTNTAFSPATPQGAATPDPVSYNTPNILYTNNPPVTLLGAIGFNSDPPATIVLGSWPNGLFGQNSATTCFLGQLDELRIYNIALSQHDVSGLFLNGQEGR